MSHLLAGRMRCGKQYHDRYLLSDVLLLADVFKNIRNTVYAHAHSDYPLAPEHLTVTKDMPSLFTRSLVDDRIKHWRPCQKLAPNLTDKTVYVCHYRNLQFYVKEGLVVAKIHRILTFNQTL